MGDVDELHALMAASVGAAYPHTANHGAHLQIGFVAAGDMTSYTHADHLA